MSKRVYKVGDRFGHWTLLKRLPTTGTNNRQWQCICDCGEVKKVTASNLTTGKSQSCASCGNRRRWKKARG